MRVARKQRIGSRILSYMGDRSAWLCGTVGQGGKTAVPQVRWQAIQELCSQESILAVMDSQDTLQRAEEQATYRQCMRQPQDWPGSDVAYPEQAGLQRPVLERVV